MDVPVVIHRRRRATGPGALELSPIDTSLPLRAGSGKAAAFLDQFPAGTASGTLGVATAI